MKLTILELDQIRLDTKAFLMKEIMECYPDTFWNSSENTKWLYKDLRSRLIEASRESIRIERILSGDDDIENESQDNPTLNKE